MARKLSPLTASLVLDIKQWTAGLEQVKRDQTAIVKALKPVVDSTKQLGTAFVAAGALIGGALLGMAKKAADYGDEMLEASQKTGINTKQLAALRLVAEQSGSSFEGVTSAVTKLSKTMFDAAAGGKEQAKVFAALGISFKDATGHVRDASEVLPEISERFAQMKDGSEKTALAIKLFGKAGADLIPTLNQGAAGFQKAAEAVEKYNVDIGMAGSKLGDDLNDSLKETSLATQGLANQIGAALLPAAIKLVAVLNNTIAAVSGVAKAHPEWTRAIAATAAILTGAGGLLLGLTALLVILPKIQSSIFLIKAAIVTTNPVVLALYGAVAAVTAAFIAFPEVRKPVMDTLQQLYQGATLLISAFTNLAFVEFKLKTGGITEAWTALKNLPTNVIDDIVASGERFSKFASSAGGLGKAFDMDGLTNDVKKAVGEMGVSMDAFGKTTKTVADRIKEMWESLRKEGGEAEVLEAVLKRAAAAHISLDTILDILGPTIKDVAGEMIQSTELMPEYIAHYNALRLSAEAFSIAQEEAAAANQAFNKSIFESTKEMRDAVKHPVEITRNVNLTVKALENLGKQKIEVRELTKSITGLSSAGYTARQIEQALGVSLEEVANRAKELGVQIDPLIKKLGQQESASRQLKESWSSAFASISDQLVDMIVDFDFSFKRLGDIAKNTAKSLLGSFLDGFLKPFKDSLSGLGESLASQLGKVVFGGSGGNQNGGTTGGLLGGLFGGLFGGGGDGFGGQRANGSLVGVPIDGVAGLFGGGGAGQLTGLAGKLSMAGGIVGMAKDAFELGTMITGKIGAGRDSANEIVKAQNAFVNETLGAILNDSSLSATNKLKQVNNAWEGFQGNLTRFSAGGGENPVTANQAFATLSPFISKIQTDLINAGAGDGSGMEGSITIAPVFHFNGTQITALEVRDIVVPEITAELESAVRGVREKWSELLANKSGSTPAPVGI